MTRIRPKPIALSAKSIRWFMDNGATLEVAWAMRTFGIRARRVWRLFYGKGASIYVQASGVNAVLGRSRGLIIDRMPDRTRYYKREYTVTDGY